MKHHSKIASAFGSGLFAQLLRDLENRPTLKPSDAEEVSKGLKDRELHTGVAKCQGASIFIPRNSFVLRRLRPRKNQLSQVPVIRRSGSLFDACFLEVVSKGGRRIRDNLAKSRCGAGLRYANRYNFIGRGMALAVSMPQRD